MGQLFRQCPKLNSEKKNDGKMTHTFRIDRGDGETTGFEFADDNKAAGSAGRARSR